MAKLPTIQSESSAVTGSAGAEMLRSNPDDFGLQGAEEIGQVGQGLESTARGGSRLLRASMYAEKRAKQMSDNTWVANQFFSTTKGLNEWQADPQNNSSEQFAKNYSDYATSQASQAVKGAPSPEAAQALQDHLDTYVSHTYDRALEATYQTKFKNSVTSVDGQISDLLDSYRNRQKTPNAMPDAEFLEGEKLLRSTINGNFGDIAPQTERKLQQTVTEQLAAGTMNENPDLARHIVQNHVGLDEEVRNRLDHQIDESQRAQMTIAADSFKRSVGDNLVQLSNGKPGAQPISEKQFGVFLPPREASEAFRQYNDQVDTIHQLNNYKQNFDGVAPQYQREEIERLHGNINGEHDQETFNEIYKHYLDNGQLLDRDRVSWLQQSNPEIRSLQETAANSGDSSRAQAVNEYHDAILKYQGVAPAMDSAGAANVQKFHDEMGDNLAGKQVTDNSHRYLDLPFNDRHLLSAGDSQRYADAINRASPTEAVDVIKKIMNNYPDPHHQAVVFNDLATMPKDPIKQEYQLAWQNKDAPWLSTYLGSVAGNESMKKMTDPKVRTELERSVENSATWNKFQQSMIGANMDRAKEISGFKEGIMGYAQSMVANGMKPDAAAGRATEELISSTLGFSSVHGRPMAILRDRGPGKPYRTDDEIGDIGRKLTGSLQYIDPREIDQKNFPSLKAFGDDESRIPRLQALRDQITQRGFFQTSQDGQSATLHILDNSGFPMEIRDRQNRPFLIHFDDLPSMTHPVQHTQAGMSPGSGTTSTTEEPDAIKSSYPLTSRYLTRSVPGTAAAAWDKWTLGLTRNLNPSGTRTNWPTTPDWIQHDVNTTGPLLPQTIGNPRGDAALKMEVEERKNRGIK